MKTITVFCDVCGGRATGCEKCSGLGHIEVPDEIKPPTRFMRVLVYGCIAVLCSWFGAFLLHLAGWNPWWK
jgi:hypothetical protein